MNINIVPDTPAFLKAAELKGIVAHKSEDILYKYVSYETAMKILTNQKLRFSAPSEFNDPYELSLQFIDFDSKKDEMIDRFRAAWQKRNPQLSRKERRGFTQKFTHQQLVEASKYTFKKERNLFRIFCASLTPLNTLMWAHYADKQRGVCLGLVIPTMFPKLGMMSFRVRYVDQMEKFQMYKAIDNERSLEIMSWIITKHRQWEYEQEVRCVIPNADPHISPESDRFVDIGFDCEQLKQVYFGMDVSDQQIREFSSLLRQKVYDQTDLYKIKTDQGFSLSSECLQY